MFNLKKMEQFLNLVSVGCKKRKVRLIKITSSIYCHSVVILFQCVPKYKKNPHLMGVKLNFNFFYYGEYTFNVVLAKELIVDEYFEAFLNHGCESGLAKTASLPMSHSPKLLDLAIM